MVNLSTLVFTKTAKTLIINELNTCVTHKICV
jgi:hypothetical protein